MSKHNECRSRSPSIIARLMGLDGMPPQSSSHREPKPMENQQHRPVTYNKAPEKKTYVYHESLRRGLSNEERFKDVFEVFDAEKEKISRSLCHRRVNANLTEAEMAFIRHKFMEAKRLSTDGKLRYSKEFNETLEALHSNKEILSKFLHPPCSEATTLELSNSPHRVNSFKSLKVDRELLGKSHISPQRHGGGAPYDNTVGLSKKRLKKRSGLKSTEIVVLKPNLGKPQIVGRTFPSHDSSCDEVGAECMVPFTSNHNSKAFGSLKATEDVSLLRHKSRDSRAIAKIVSRQMKASGGNHSSMNFEVSRLRGCSWDKSSAGSNSKSESKLVSMISRARTDFNRKNHNRTLPSRSPESSVRKEAMRRLSGRWKLAHKCEQEIEIKRSNTLAEILATSDKEARLASFKGTTFEERLSRRSESNVGQSDLQEPIGISSKDGWKGTDKSNPLKTRKVVHVGRTCSYKIVLPKKLSTRDGFANGISFHHKDFILSNNSKPVSISSCFIDNSSSHINRPSSSKIHHMDGELYKDKLQALETHNTISAHAESNTENGSDYEDAKSVPSLEPLDMSAVTSFTNCDISDRPTEELDHSFIPQQQPC